MIMSGLEIHNAIRPCFQVRSRSRWWLAWRRDAMDLPRMWVDDERLIYVTMLISGRFNASSAIRREVWRCRGGAFGGCRY